MVKLISYVIIKGILDIDDVPVVVSEVSVDLVYVFYI